MGDVCIGGEFDGYALTTTRDRALCKDGGGEVVPRTSDGGGCSAQTVALHQSEVHGRAMDLSPLHTARAVWERTAEAELLTRLSAESVPVVARILDEDPDLAGELVAGLDRLASLAAAALDPTTDAPVYTAEDHEVFVRLAGRVAERAEEARVRELLDEALRSAESFVGQPPLAVQERLGVPPELAETPPTRTEVALLLPLPLAELVDPSPTSDLVALPVPRPGPVLLHEVVEATWDRTTVGELLAQVGAAEEAVAAKAAALGGQAGEPLGDLTPVDGGFVRRYAGCDVYFSPATGAHEVHGDIRRKYTAVNGPTLLGLPVTDESGCPDGVGRFNHFAKASSIYWTPRTGPFYVRGVVRFRWASEGWETGPVGYPTGDEELLPGLSPGDAPDIRWNRFEHGFVVGRKGVGQVAPAAGAPSDRIREALFRAVGRRLPSSSVTIGHVTVSARAGLYGVDVLAVEGWAYGFWHAVPRALSLRVRGFISMSPGVVPDPTFEIDLRLRFSTQWAQQSFFYPASKTVVATLLSTRVHVYGVFSETLAEAIRTAVANTFRPGPGNPEVTGPSMVLATVPTGANQRGDGNLDFLDVMLAADGSLQVVVNPLPAPLGAFRQAVAQAALNNALENL